MVALVEIKNAVQKIVKTFSPERVVLFGSFARQAAGQDSDVDLLVVVPHEGSAAKCAAEIRQVVDFRFPCDLLVRSPQKVAERLRMGDPFIKEIFANGKPFTNPLALEWLVKADADFVTANRELRARKMPNYDAACFHAQQCVEKLLKSIMIHDDLVPPKSHDLSYLLSLTLPQRPMWEVFRKDFQLLSAYAVEYRYPGESATKEMAREALRCCSKFREQFDREIGRFELK